MLASNKRGVVAVVAARLLPLLHESGDGAADKLIGMLGIDGIDGIDVIDGGGNR